MNQQKKTTTPVQIGNDKGKKGPTIANKYIKQQEY